MPAARTALMCRSLALLVLLVTGCGGESARDVPVCAVAWREIRLPAQYRPFFAADAVGLDGRLYLFRADPESEAVASKELGLVYEPPSSFRIVTAVGAPPLAAPIKAVTLGAEVVLLSRTGNYSDELGTTSFGGRYSPEADSWSILAGWDDLASTYVYGGVSAADQLIVARDVLEDDAGDGGSDPFRAEYVAYEPATGAWRDMPAAPGGAHQPALASTGKEVIAWGGTLPGETGEPIAARGGAIFDVGANSWRSLAFSGAPPAVASPTVVWTGNELFVWSGSMDGAGDGNLYDPDQDTWRRISSEGAPSAREAPATVAVEGRVVIWGGVAAGEAVAGGASYDGRTDSWSPVPTQCGPAARAESIVTWVGDALVVWGGVATCPSSADPEDCARTEAQRAWLLPRDALFSDAHDPPGCRCPSPVGE